MWKVWWIIEKHIIVSCNLQVIIPAKANVIQNYKVYYFVYVGENDSLKYYSHSTIH